MAPPALLLALSLAGATASSFPSFDVWASQQRKAYNATEREARALIYRANLALAAAHNSNPASTFTMGASPFADLTLAEFSSLLAARRPALGPRPAAPRSLRAAPALPPSANWLASGCVGAVANQGQCANDWLLAGLRALEGACCVAHGNKSAPLSAQEVIDCGGGGGGGCTGGEVGALWKFAQARGGLCTAAAYPDTAGPGVCHDSTCPKFCAPKAIADVPANSAPLTLAALAAQPIVVGVDAGSEAWQLYSGGVISAASCAAEIDHVVLAVGYDTTGPAPFLRVQNSWGTAWGELGCACPWPFATCCPPQPPIHTHTHTHNTQAVTPLPLHTPPPSSRRAHRD
jgi:hypothetical protein